MLSPEFLRILVLGIFLMTMAVVAFAYGPYQVRVLDVKDGDTVKVAVAVWPQVEVLTDVRIFGIDTPETRRGKKGGVSIPECELLLGVAAKSYARSLLSKEENVFLIDVDPRNTKYAGRISGDLLLGDDKFSSLMLIANHAVPYSGGTREVWPCE